MEADISKFTSSFRLTPQNHYWIVLNDSMENTMNFIPFFYDILAIYKIIKCFSRTDKIFGGGGGSLIVVLMLS